MTILQEREQKVIEQGIFKVVKNVMSIGMETKDIMNITGVTQRAIDEIKEEILN